MPEDSPLIVSLRTAVAAAPADVPLRLHLAELLLDAGRADAAVAEVAVALQHAPGDVQARQLMARAMGVPVPQAPETGTAVPVPQAPETGTARAPRRPFRGVRGRARRVRLAGRRAEVGNAVPPRFVEAPLRADRDGGPGDAAAWDVERPGGVRLADVGGMREMKDRLEAAFLAPLRNPGLRRLYGKSLRGGLLSDDAVRPGDPPPPWTDRLPPRLLLAAAVLPTLATIWFDRKKQP